MTHFETHQLHSYGGKEELPALLQFVGECNMLVDFCGCLHLGDVCHFLSNTMRGGDPGKHCYVYKNLEGQIQGLVLLYPTRFHGYDILIHPHHRGSELEAALLTWGEQQILTNLQATGSDAPWIGIDVMNCDTSRQKIVQASGYTSAEEPGFYYTTRSLLEPIPASVLPPGFSIRSVAGEHEADAVQAVHAGSFSSRWQAGEYLNVMRTPGFHLDREIVVVAPDQRFAAFLIYWIDPITKSALFEPVGCHSDFQRQGLTRALMYEGMRRMLAYGMSTALVLHQPAQTNPAAAALYHSVGFTLKYTITDYRKHLI